MRRVVLARQPPPTTGSNTAATWCVLECHFCDVSAPSRTTASIIKGRPLKIGKLHISKAAIAALGQYRHVQPEMQNWGCSEASPQHRPSTLFKRGAVDQAPGPTAELKEAQRLG